jgi:hypothetical protein
MTFLAIQGSKHLSEVFIKKDNLLEIKYGHIIFPPL